MPPMMILEQLSAAKSKNKITKIINSAWDSNSNEFFVGLQMSLDQSIPVPKTVPMWEGEDSEPSSCTMEEFYFTITEYKNQPIDAFSNKIQELANRISTSEWNNWYRKILTKKLQTELPMNIIVDTLKQLTSPNKAV